MAHASTPSVKMVVTKDLFNRLVGILDSNAKLNIEIDGISTNAEKLRNKLLTYSVPREREDKSEVVDIRFFPNEASSLIWQLLLNIDSDELEENYIETLKVNRNKTTNS